MGFLDRDAVGFAFLEAAGEGEAGGRSTSAATEGVPAKEQILFADHMIDAAVKLIRVAERGGAGDVIKCGRARGVGRGVILKAGVSDEAEPGLGNEVGGEGLAAIGGGVESERVEDLAARGEVAFALFTRREALIKRVGAARAERFEVGHEKGFVAQDGTADNGSKLVAAEGIDAAREEATGVEFVVPQELEQAAVKVVGAGAECEIDCGRTAAVLGGKGVLLNLEFLHRFNGRGEGRLAAGFGARIDSIEEEADLIGALAIDGEAVTLRAAGEFGDSGDQFGKVEEVAAVEWKSDDFALADDLTDFRAALIEDRSGGDDFELGGGVANFELDVCGDLLGDLHFKAGDLVRLETLSRDTELIDAWDDQGKDVVAGGIGGGGAGGAGALVDESDGNGGNGGLGLIGDLAGDAAVGDLGVEEGEGEVSDANIAESGDHYGGTPDGGGVTDLKQSSWERD